MRLTVTPDDLAASVMAVPPLARTAAGDLDEAANGAAIAHLEAGGVSTVLYGGNALAHHWPLSVYGDWLDRLSALVAADTWLLPSVGPDAGKMMDQAAILKSRRFPVALLLPMSPPSTHEGMAEAMRRFHGECGVRLSVYIKTDGYIGADILGALVREDVVFGVKYAVPRENGAPDAYLDEIVAAVGAERVISGFGEPPAVAHMLDFGLAGYTAGCVCVAPAMSTALFKALKAKDRTAADRLLAPFMPLEELRNEINEIRVLHEAVALSGVAPTGPILAPMSAVPATRTNEIETAAKALLSAEQAFRAALAA